MRISSAVSIRQVVAGFSLICLAAGSVYSGIVFEAGFNGPGNGAGGVYDMVTVGGTGRFINETSNLITLSLENDGLMTGGGGYCNCVLTNPPSTSTISILEFRPTSTTNSLDAMTSVVNGDRVINGGFDFFFRSDEALLGNEMRTLDVDNRGNNSGLRFVFTSQDPGLRLEMIAKPGGLLIGGEGGSAADNRAAQGTFAFTSNTVYHIGQTFETDPEGNVTAKIWCQEGTGAIDLTTAAPIASMTFGIDENIVSNGFYNGTFNMGQLRFSTISYASMTQKYDLFRIYDETPTSFGSLEASPVAWRDSNPETVLQADFNGSGSGTGGQNDIVTLGGTATLVDAGNYSDASVLDALPFRTLGMNSSGGYLNVLTTNNVVTGIYGRTTITPASPASSLNSMTVFTNGHVMLRGGLDFFFRNERDIEQSAEFRPIDTDNRGNDGLRLVLYNSYATKLRLEIISSGNGLYEGGEGGALKSSFAYDIPAHIASHTIYHVGISFDSTDDGTVTASVWLKEGTGPINLRQDFPIGSLTFGINEAVVTDGFTSGSFNFGKLSMQGEIPSTQDYDCLRIYNDTPVVFGELPVPPAGTLILVN